nr:YfbM family protein [Streptomyces sp. NBC_00974]
MSIEFTMRRITPGVFQRIRAGEHVYDHIAESDAVGKDWGVLVHILSNGDRGNPSPPALAILGGICLEGEDVADYGGTRILAAEEVARISRELASFDEGEIVGRYATLEFDGVYGSEGSTPSSPVGDYQEAFDLLREFYGAAAESGDAMMVWLG